MVPVPVRNSILSFPASGSCLRLPLPGSVQAMLVPVPVRNSILLIPASGSCQIYSLPGFVGATLVPVPVRIATSWLRSGGELIPLKKYLFRDWE